MRHFTRAAGLFVAALLLVAPQHGLARGAGSPDWSGLPWPPDGDLTNTTALSRLIALPTGEGNACSRYLKLTALEGDPRPYPALGVDLKTRRSGSRKEKAKLRSLAADAEVLARLEVFRKGAASKGCRVLGELYPFPKPPANWIAAKTVDFRPILSHAAVVEELAFKLASQGKTAEAAAWLEALVVAGWHLQQDLSLISNMIGVLVGSHAASALGELLEASEDPAQRKRGEQWSAYAGLTRWHRHEAYDRLLKPLLTKAVIGSDEGVAKLRVIAEDERMMRGARHEAMLVVAVSNLFRKGALPPSSKQKMLLRRWQRLDDPALADAARAWSRYLDLDPDARAALAEEISKME